MGAVYRARDLHFLKSVRLVAIKEMVSQIRDPMVRKTIIRNFEREANILATLRHPAIPRIYDFFTQEDRSYLVMEFVNGKDLETLLTENDNFFAEDQVLAWAIELTDVLHSLHTHDPEPIIFRDMKPANVMINPQNHVVLVDFGIAKIFQAGQKGTMIGTEGYCPPEQYQGEATPRSDIYALGATLHHILTRRDPQLETPFTFNDRPIRDINDNVSPDFEAVITKAVSYKPEERYTTADAMKEALLSVAQKTGGLSKVTATSISLSAKTSGIKPIWAFACEDEIRGTPVIHDGIVYVGSYDHNLYALNAANGDFKWKYACEGGIAGKPAFYENQVIFGSDDNRVHAVHAQFGKVTWTYFTDGPVRSSPRIAESHVFIGSDDYNLHVINTATGNRAWRAEASSPIRSTPYVTNELVYFGSEEGDFYCFDFKGEMKWRMKAKRAITSSPIVHENSVYFGSVDGNIYSVDAKQGYTIWRFRLGKGTISTPTIVDDLLFTGSVGNSIHCIDIRSSKEVWRFGTEHQVTSSPIIYKDSLYCGSVDGHIYCLEYSTGRLRWKFKTEGPVTGTPAVYDDIVYIGSTDHHFYALLA